MALFIYTSNPVLKALLLSSVEKYRSTDSGFDIPMIGQIVDITNPNHKFDLDIVVASSNENLRPTPSILLPRSSLSNTPFRLANSVGLIDMGYRGNVQARVDLHNATSDYVIHEGARLFQICKHDFMPWSHVTIVDSLDELPPPPDNRGIGAFGSTGK